MQGELQGPEDQKDGPGEPAGKKLVGNCKSWIWFLILECVVWMLIHLLRPFSHNPSLKVPSILPFHHSPFTTRFYSNYPPRIPPQKKNTHHPASHSYFAVALGVPSAILLRNWQLRGWPQGCWDLPIHWTLWETLWEPPLVPHREEPAGTTRAVSVQMEASKDENLSLASRVAINGFLLKKAFLFNSCV